MNILLIEDELKIADFVIDGLAKAQYHVEHITDGVHGLARILQGQHDLVVLDLMLPGLSGFEVLRQLRASGNTVPVVILSAKVDLPDRLLGFESGADDYLPKPFYVEELVARIRSVTGRGLPDKPQTISVDQLTLEIVSRRAQWHEVSAVLSQREFSLLAYLMRTPGHIYSRKQILKQVWRIDYDPQTNVVDVYVRRIKRKLCRGDNEDLSPIESVRGVGYRLNIQGGS
jgi:DNA-binding response OmpR family regulator